MRCWTSTRQFHGVLPKPYRREDLEAAIAAVAPAMPQAERSARAERLRRSSVHAVRRSGPGLAGRRPRPQAGPSSATGRDGSG